ncbi:MAG: flagellar basal body rod protein FlgC [Deltaproteobacteria bacterium]|nr:flagellar basal body rod protein FlgC [Deltaproteobacteria bacterium]
MADILDTFSIASSGLAAERVRLQSIASNMANARTTRTPEGGPYQRQVPVFQAEAIDPFGESLDAASSRVQVAEVKTDDRPPVRVYDPTHPDAGPDGFVAYPDINVLQEMVDLMTAQRAYEANANVVEATRDMAMTALGIGR